MAASRKGEGDAAREEAVIAEETAAQCALVRDLLGNPFRPVALDPPREAVPLARAAYDERLLPSGRLDPLRLSVLADALEESGAADAIVAHLRSPGPHVRGCWAVDLVLGQDGKPARPS
ncbi:MAG: hypothetical protein K2W96_06825 [Gemmataceae bacterium]|nr:hypothetical protein [Gemmataceae bacterium]